MVDLSKVVRGTGRWMDRIATPMAAQLLNMKKVEKTVEEILEEQGVEIPVDAQGKSVLDFDLMVKVFSPITTTIKGKNIVTVLRNGEREYFQVHDEMLLQALTSIIVPPSVISRALRAPASFLRAAATLTLEFLARNPIRDTFEASVLSKYGFRLGWSTIYGALQIVAAGSPKARRWLNMLRSGQQQEMYEQFINAGGGGRAMVSMDRDYIASELRQLGAEDEKTRMEFFTSIPRTGLDMLRAMQEMLENASRVGEFALAIKKEGATAEGFARGGGAAAEVTINFKRAGTTARQFNSMIAFFNASVQGRVRLYEEYMRNPKAFIGRGLLTITMVTFAAWLVNKDDPEYLELPLWERLTYWHIPIGRGRGHRWVRVPKPWDLGVIFGNLPQSLWDTAVGNQELFDQSISADFPEGESAYETGIRMLIGLVPNAFLPLVQVYSDTGYDFFRQRPLINIYDVDLPPEQQKSRWTSETAIFIAKESGIPAAKVDSLIYGYSAGMGKYATDIIDKPIRWWARRAGDTEGATMSGDVLTDSWGLRALFRRSAAAGNAASITQFYKAKNQLLGVQRAIKNDKAAGNQAKARERKAENQHLFDLSGRMKRTDREIKVIRRKLLQLEENKVLDGIQKRKQNDRLYEEMVDWSRWALGKRKIYQGR